MGVTPLPTADRSDEIISRQLARGEQPRGQSGDLCTFCVDDATDVWAVWPVAKVDSHGTVLSVRAATGEDRSLWVLAALDVYFCNPPDPFDPEKMAELMLWKQHRGLAAVQAAGREAWREGYPRDAA